MGRTVTRMRLSGLQGLQRALLDLPNEIARQNVKERLADSLIPMRDAAIELAPDAEPFGVGLRSNIITSTKLTASQRKTEGFDRIAEAKAFVGVDGEKPGIAPHGILAEFGTGPRQHESGKSVGDMPAIPFMRPAFDMTAGAVLKRVAAHFRVLLANAVKASRRN